MWELPWIANQHDATSGQRHRNEQVQWIRTSSFVYNHTTEAQASDSILAAILEQGHLTAYRLLAGRTDDAAVGLHRLPNTALLDFKGFLVPLHGDDRAPLGMDHRFRKQCLKLPQQVAHIVWKPVALSQRPSLFTQSIEQPHLQLLQSKQQSLVGFLGELSPLKRFPVLRLQPALIARHPVEQARRALGSIIQEGHGLGSQRAHRTA